MEEALDEVAAGRGEAEKWLHTFYFGNGTAGLQELVSEENLAKIDMSEVNKIHIAGGEDGEPEIMVRVWNTGESLHRGEDKCPLPADMAPDELTAERAVELLGEGRGRATRARRRSRDRREGARAQRPLRPVRAAR